MKASRCGNERQESLLEWKWVARMRGKKHFKQSKRNWSYLEQASLFQKDCNYRYVKFFKTRPWTDTLRPSETFLLRFFSKCCCSTNSPFLELFVILYLLSNSFFTFTHNFHSNKFAYLLKVEQIDLLNDRKFTYYSSSLGVVFGSS